jgi:DNA repair protein RecO (recombination protein O)
MTRAIDFEPAHVLSLRPYRETSQLLEVFSRNHGRVGLVARGVRGPKSKLRGLLQPFRPLLLSWRETGELGTLSSVEAGGLSISLVGERVFHGWYVNELLLKLLQRHEPHPDLYADYAQVLGQLGGAGAEPGLRIFEKRLLAGLGYALPLDADFEPAHRYRFDPEQGATRVDEAAIHAFAGSSLTALRNEHFDSREALRDARKILRSALDRQLGGRTLETPRLLREMRAQTVAAAAGPGSANGD